MDSDAVCGIYVEDGCGVVVAGVPLRVFATQAMLV